MIQVMTLRLRQAACGHPRRVGFTGDLRSQSALRRVWWCAILAPTDAAHGDATPAGLTWRRGPHTWTLPTERGGLAMKFGLFYEHQVPRPWDIEAERRVLLEALEQVELADKLGIEHVWEVE